MYVNSCPLGFSIDLLCELFGQLSTLYLSCGAFWDFVLKEIDSLGDLEEGKP